MANNQATLQIVVDAQNNADLALAEVGRNLNTVKSQTEDLRAGMQAIGTVGTVAFAALALFTKNAVEAGATFEQTSISFRTMIGNAAYAQELLAQIDQFASHTPFQIPQLEQASKELLAYGVSASVLIPTLKMLGDISSGVGMDKLPQLVLAFGQVQSKGHLAGQELLQFADAGVGLRQELEKDLGVTSDRFEKLMEAGQISSAQVTQALQNMTSAGGLFNNAMSNQMTSLGGLWSNLSDQVILTSRAIGVQLVPILKPLVEDLIAVTQQVGAFAQAHPKLTAAILLGVLALTALMAVLLPLALILPGLQIMLVGLTAAFAASTIACAPLVIAIAGVIAIMAVLAASGLTTKQGWELVWIGIKAIAADAANGVIGIVQDMINFVISGVNSAIDAINRVISLAQKVPGIGKSISSISELSSVSLGRIDTTTIAASSVAGGSSPVTVPANNVTVTGNVLLNQASAQQIGDLLMSKLKLSSQT